ncbi:hypothetical protein AB0H88_27280 [Nonomuraea sp. NPDC050680]|uniref:hypothetical protein n=1 Tax=Nonomuraea sp. NPDC050680 TaxID=3154630 RepID=UPI00340E861B
MIYQHAVRGADQMITNAIDQQFKQHDEGSDDDGSAGVLTPVGQLHANCTEDRNESQKRSKPDRETLPDLAFQPESG